MDRVEHAGHTMRADLYAKDHLHAAARECSENWHHGDCKRKTIGMQARPLDRRRFGPLDRSDKCQRDHRERHSRRRRPQQQSTVAVEADAA